MSECREERSYRDIFDGVIEATIKNAGRIASKNPGLVLTGAKIAYHQKKAAAKRAEYERKGVLVPGVMMISLTSRCNLTCMGCYMNSRECRLGSSDMTDEEVSDIISQARDLGVSAVVFAGGEPFLRLPLILSLAKRYHEMLFPVFTNGLLIDEAVSKELGRHKNIVPMLSLEGFSVETDFRRGEGTYEKLMDVCRRLSERGMFFGCSLMVTSKNMPCVTGEEFVSDMVSRGVLAFVYVEYVPIEAGTEDLVLTKEQQSHLREKLHEYCDRFPALFIGFPGDEDAYGGCLAAGRGFVHVSPSGDLEPCPAAPFSDMNLKTVPLEDALKSGLLEKIRKSHGMLTESGGGCALWANREWVKTLHEKK
ncbi:MoaA/NifB/PqqE/SkfB family radical SAM enzyme [Methanomicrobium sp. W14]|uniref:radical SAM/SPASM domain-containing protein n=1 Tax=Methanomicrobium sp. W14 TaxID=2817839 RepID=UPI001AE3DAE9|nr:radical SAM protein [Methanomicrobium sp. W14]MBP2134208.1 MoaA/NifB/PqqE/SkfB family radical SAM enzyme [Methanomicrobium sp. W14]